MNYDIELNANDSSVLETQYAFTQGDYGQIQFSIRVKVNGAYVTNAQRAYVVFTLPNGYVVTGADMSKSVATYTYPFQGSELQVPGTILADVKLVYTDGQISSNKFSFICRYDPLHDKSFEAGPYISQLQQIVDDGQAKIDYLKSLIEILQTDVGGTPVMRSDLHNTRDAVTAGTKAVDANMTQYMLLKSDVTHQNENDANKIVAADSLYTTRANLQSQIDTTNSNLNDNGTLLFSGAISASTSYNFSQAISNYKRIIIVLTLAKSIETDTAYEMQFSFVRNRITAANVQMLSARRDDSTGFSAGIFIADTSMYVNAITKLSGVSSRALWCSVYGYLV